MKADSSTHTSRPDISWNVCTKWQGIVDLLSEIVGVPSGLIMKVHPGEIEVFVSSHSEGNPYERGEKAHLNTGLYCETVMAQRSLLLVPDARKDPKWDHNPDIELGMVSYLGFPLIWPDGEIFGTICVLDRRENGYCAMHRELMERFREMVENDLGVISENIEERKDALEELKSSETRFRDIIEKNADGIVIVDVDGRVRFVNPAAGVLFAREQKAFLGKPFGFPMTTDEATEVNIIRKDGELVTAEMRVVPVEWERQSAYLASLRDITKRKRAEEARRRSEQALAQAQRIANLGNWDWDIARNTLSWSDEIYRIFGLKPRDFEGTHEAFLKSVHPDDRELVKKAVDEAVSGGKSYDIEHRIVRPDGTERIVHGQAEVSYDVTGEPVRMIGVVHDITERKGVEAAVRESEERFRTLASNIPGAVYRCTRPPGRTVHFISDGIIDTCGHPASDFVDDRVRSYESIIYPKDREMVQEVVDQSISRKGPYVVEYRVVCHDGEVRWVYDKGQAVFDGEGEVLCLDGVLFDISEERILKEQLLQSEKLSAVGELVAGVAHEMNNPLTGIVGFSDLLQMELDGVDEGKKEKLKRIHTEAQRLARIVSNLLSFARKGKNEKMALCINDVLEQALALRRYELEVGGINVATHVGQRLPPVEGDGQQLQQVFLNIINNAQQAMHKAHGKGALSITTHAKDGMVVIEFEDDGSGIPKRYINRIFDPFFTTKEVGKGTGLGLSVSHGIVHEHGGTLTARSEEGKGTTFTITLPAIGEGAA